MSEVELRRRPVPEQLRLWAQWLLDGKVDGTTAALGLEVIAQQLEATGDRPYFRCPRCEAVSYNATDISEGYCGRCHDWTGRSAGDLLPGERYAGERYGLPDPWED